VTTGAGFAGDDWLLAACGLLVRKYCNCTQANRSLQLEFLSAVVGYTQFFEWSTGDD